MSRDKIHTNQQEPNVGALENASTYKFGLNNNYDNINGFIVPNGTFSLLFTRQALCVRIYVFTVTSFASCKIL